MHAPETSPKDTHCHHEDGGAERREHARARREHGEERPCFSDSRCERRHERRLGTSHQCVHQRHDGVCVLCGGVDLVEKRGCECHHASRVGHHASRVGYYASRVGHHASRVGRYGGTRIPHPFTEEEGGNASRHVPPAR